MKPPLQFVAGLILALGSSHADGPGAASYRTFKNAAGQELRARLLSVEGDKANLRTSAGKDVTIPISTLSLDDQSYIQQWDPRERLRAAAVARGEGQLGLPRFMASKGYTSAGLSLKGKDLEIDVRVNGRPQTFLFDSGRVLTLLDRTLAEELGVQVHPDVDFGDFPMADGSVVKVYAGTTKGFAVGEANIPGFELGVVDLPRIGINAKGVVAADVLQYFDGIVDWQTMRVYLEAQ